MDIQPGKLHYVYIINVPAKSVNLLRFMVVHSTPNAAKGIIHAQNDEVYIIGIVGLTSTQCDFAKNFISVHYNRSKHLKKK